MLYKVSFAVKTMVTQPVGRLHTTTGAATVALGRGVNVVVSVATSVFTTTLVISMIGVFVGSSIEVARIGGKGVGVGSAFGVFSASESDIPPMTSKTETTAMMSPPPISRNVRIFISPQPDVNFGRWVTRR